MCLLQLLVPLDRFLSPDESNVDLIQLYIQAILSKTVTSRRCPVMYLIAVHHINRFIYQHHHHHHQQQQLRHWTIRQIIKLQDDVCISTTSLFVHCGPEKPAILYYL